MATRSKKEDEEFVKVLANARLQMGKALTDFKRLRPDVTVEGLPGREELAAGINIACDEGCSSAFDPEAVEAQAQLRAERVSEVTQKITADDVDINLAVERLAAEEGLAAGINIACDEGCMPGFEGEFKKRAR